MIKWVRLDERMIHGQVATKWSRTLGVDRIVVADDTAAVALEYGKRWLELEPDNPEAQKLVSDCEGYLSEEPVEMYDEADWDAVEKHIEKYFGHYDHVFHESVSTGIHLDICVIPPRGSRASRTCIRFSGETTGVPRTLPCAATST